MTTDAPPPKLTNMELIYQLEGQPPAQVRIHNRSLIAWDETRPKRQWPVATEAPSLWQTFILWHHLTRTGQVSVDFNAFRDICEAVEAVDDEDGQPVQYEVDPTQPTVTPDSVSLSASQ